MKSYFVIFMAGLLFLGACQTDSVDDSNEDSPVNLSDMDADKGDDSEALTTTNDVSPVTSYWECRDKRNFVVKYFLNQQPTTVDNLETEQERRRICELSQIVNGEASVLFFAHNVEDFCAQKLNEEIRVKRSQGWLCSQVESGE